MLRDGEIENVLETTPDPQEAVDRLVREANRAGGVDNITAVLLDFAEDSRDERAATATNRAAPETAPEPAPDRSTPTRIHVNAFGEPVPQRIGGARTLRTAGVRAGLALGLFVVAVVGLRVYLDSQWFVGVSNGRVAVFRGIPASVGGWDLNSVVVETTIPAAEAEDLAVYRDLADGITADDRASADDIVEQIRDDVAEAGASGP
jgi:protein phosphatase